MICVLQVENQEQLLTKTTITIYFMLSMIEIFLGSVTPSWMVYAGIT